MLVVMNKKATQEEIDAVVTSIEAKGYTARPIPGGDRVSIGILNNKGPVDASVVLGLPGVKDAIPVASTITIKERIFRQMTLTGNVTIKNFYWCWWRNYSGERFAGRFYSL